jgi:hypothetical protein
MKQKAIICDIDSTLSNTDHRHHYISGEKKDWDSFNGSAYKDRPNHWCVNLLVAMKVQGYEILLVTGRSDNFFLMTQDWLNKNGIPFDRLLMRKNGDWRKDFEIKSEIYINQVEPIYDVLFCVEDRKQVVDMWRSLSLTCLQCAPGEF